MCIQDGPYNIDSNLIKFTGQEFVTPQLVCWRVWLSWIFNMKIYTYTHSAIMIGFSFVSYCLSMSAHAIKCHTHYDELLWLRAGITDARVLWLAMSLRHRSCATSSPTLQMVQFVLGACCHHSCAQFSLFVHTEEVSLEQRSPKFTRGDVKNT